ncbi:MAG: molybdate ABC transporter substrate-binding protein [Candidatus Dormibacteria bacterium]
MAGRSTATGLRTVLLAAVTGLLGALAGCGPSAGQATAPAPVSPLHGQLTVLAAASLAGAVTATDTDLQRRHPGFEVTPSFAGSQLLVTQLLAGAPADLVATADRPSMQKLVDAGLVEAPQLAGRNRLAIVVAPGNPRHVTGLADLARPDLVVVLADPAVPVGRAAASVLRRRGVTVHPRSLELDVKAVLHRVVSGEADAAIVYVTDLRAAGAAATGVDVPAIDNAEVDYPVAVVRAAAHRAAAVAYLNELLHGAGRRALLAAGFLAPSAAP